MTGAGVSGVLSGLLLVALAAAPQQEPQSSFPAEAELVTVDVVVAGRDGLPVLGLRAEDFAVAEDGVPQEIVAFEAVPRASPSPPSAPTAPAPRSSSNQEPSRKESSLFVVVFDELHLEPAEAERARAAIRDLLDTGVGGGDRVALVGTGGGPRCTARMPQGRGALLQVLDRLQGRLVNEPVRDRMTDWEAMRIDRLRDPVVTDTVMRRFLETREIQQKTRLPRERPDPEEERQNLAKWRSQVQAHAAGIYARSAARNEQTLAVVAREVSSLATAPGRKAVVLASGGFIADPHLAGPRQVVAEARRANAAVYFLDARGLVGAPFEMQAENPRRTFFQDLGSTLVSETRERSEGSEGLAADTGGFSITNANDLSDGLSRIGREARSYYLLGYAPATRPADARFREIRVKVARDGVGVRARRGYFAPRAADRAVPRTEGRDEDMLRALYAPLDQDEVPLRAIVDVFDEAAPGKVAVRLTVEADLRALEFEEKGGTSRDTLELLLLVARQDDGESTRLDQQLEMKLSPDTRACYERSWFPITRRLELAPGHHQARIVARDGNTGRLGTLTLDFAVPGGGGLRLSSVALSDRVREDPRDAARVLEPTARRRFASSGLLHGAFEVYGAARDAATGGADVKAGFSVRRSDGTFLLAEAETPVVPAPNGALARRLGLPLDGVPPGAYELIVVATDRVAGQTVEAREPFVVEGEGTLAVADVLPLPCRPEARGLSARYWAIVDLHAGGDVSRAIEELEALPDAGVRKEIARLVDMAARAAGCARCPDLEVLGRRPVAVAAMLHSDAGWRVSATSRRRSQELARAGEVLDALRSLPGGSGFARRWFLASTLCGHQRMDWETAERVAAEGLKRFPDDPELLLAQGTLLETLGWRATSDAQVRRPYLERAEAALARAQDLAGSDEATLRLAHVRWRLGRTSAARTSLGRLAAETGEKRWRYLAFLFLGGVLEEEGALSEAARAYQRAVETQPDTQAGRMALAHCLVRLGNVGAARAAVADALALTRPRDPFWRYPWGRSEEGDGTLATLRAEAPGCCH